MESEFVILLSIVVGMIAGGFGVIFAFLNYQYRKKMDSLKLTQEKEQELAEGIEQKIKDKLADSVKQDTQNYVDHEINYVKREISSAIQLEHQSTEYKVEALYSKIELVISARAVLIQRLDALEKGV